MFYKNAVLTSEAEHDVSIISRIGMTEELTSIRAGVYDDGLITILDNKTVDWETLGEWRWLAGERALPVAFTCWGDFIYVSFEKNECFFVHAASGTQDSLGKSVGRFLNEGYFSEEIREHVLMVEEFNAVRESSGTLYYGKYIDRNNGSRYSLKDFYIYLEILGQTHQQMFF